MSDLRAAANPITRTSTITLHGPVAAVFPLFNPVREAEWAPEWAPRFVGGPPQVIAEHLVFITPAHGPDEPDYVWTLSKYAPEQTELEYTVFTPERVWWVTIHCRALDERITAAEITYTYCGLTDHGRARNAQALAAMFAHDLRDWQQAINHYLATGTPLAHH
jgi:hypothetical protein